MAVYSGPTIVNSDLILKIDLGNPKTSVNGTKKDLVNQLTLTEVNGVAASYTNGGEWIFDGIDDHVSLGTPSVLNVTQEETIIAWINPTSATGSYRGRIGNRHGGFLTCADSRFGYEGMNDVGSWGNNMYSASNTLVSNVWQHIAFTFKQNDRVDLYYNGSYLTGKVVSGAQASSGNVYLIGSEHIGGWGSPAYYAGKIGMVLNYSRKITASEIKQNFEATRGRYGI